jgi:hypothetical protein
MEEVAKETVVRVLENKIPIPTLYIDCGQLSNQGTFNGFDTEYSDTASSGRVAGGH